MNKKLTAFGEVMMRLEVQNHLKLSQGSKLNYSFSGTGVNVMSALAHFGYDTSLVTRLPDNTLGDAALAQIQKLGIQSPFIERAGKYLGMYFLEQGFAERSSQVTYTNRLESSFNTSRLSDYAIEKLIEERDLIHFCGISLAMGQTMQDNIKNLAKKAKDNQVTIVFDCNYRPTLWGEKGHKKARPHYETMLELADIVMMNEQDAMHILNMKTDERDRLTQLKTLIPRVAEKFDIPLIAGTQRSITGTNQHALTGYIFQDRQFAFHHSEPFAVLDRIGAGDAYTAGIIHAYLEHWKREKAVAFATLSSQLAHTTIGDSPITKLDEIIRLMDSSNSTQDIQR